MKAWFSKIAVAISHGAGSPQAFVVAVVTVLVWAILGPIFNFSDTWQLVINTGTTVVTFLVVFLIQHTQNHDTAALQLKLDELIHAIGSARDEVAGAEGLAEEEMEAMKPKVG